MPAAIRVSRMTGGLTKSPPLNGNASAQLQELVLNNSLLNDEQASPSTLFPQTWPLLHHLNCFQAFARSKESYYANLLKTTANKAMPTNDQGGPPASGGDASQYFQNQCWHKLRYANGDCYEGEHFYGYSHGIGVYQYAQRDNDDDDDEGNATKQQQHRYRRVYYGCFYGGLMEGPGCEVMLYDGGREAVFEGIFKAGQRFGPGILRYVDGSADVGLWKGEHLAQFFFEADDSFTMADFPDMMPPSPQPARNSENADVEQEKFAIGAEEERVLSQQRFNRPRNGGDPTANARKFTMADCEQAFDSQKYLHLAPTYPDNQLLITYLMNSHTLAQTSALDDKMLNEAFVMRCKRAFERVAASGAHGQTGGQNSNDIAGAGSFVYWSKNPMHEKFQKFAALQLKMCANNTTHRSASLLSFDLMSFQESAVKLTATNSGQWPAGTQELLAKEFVDAATHGNAARIQQLLFDDTVYIDVADNNGYNALIAAAVNRHYHIVNLLLDFGANVNHFTNESMTALSACATLYFSFSTKFNVWLDDLRKKSVAATPIEKGFIEEQPYSRLSNDSTDKEPSERGLEPVSAARSVSTAAARKPSLSIYKSGVRPPSVEQQSLLQTTRKASTSAQRGKTGANAAANLPVTPLPVATCDSLDSNQHPDDVIAPALALIVTGSFDSMEALKNHRIRVTDQQIQTAAITLSTNDEVLEGRRDRYMTVTRSKQHQTTITVQSQSTADAEAAPVKPIQPKPSSTFEMLFREKMLYLAFLRSEQMRMRESIRLLLKRGANPNFCEIPMPLLFLAMKGADTEMVRMLLAKNIDANQRLKPEMGGLTPLHAAMAVPGAYALEIAKLLLEAGADPNARDYFDIHAVAAVTERTSAEGSTHESAEEGTASGYPNVNVKYEPDRQGYYGKTPLHVVATRDCRDPTNTDLVNLLKASNADLNKVFSNETPLATALRLYNDNVVEALLCNGADANVRLGAQLGTALCIILTRPLTRNANNNDDLKTLDPRPVAQEIIRLVDLLITVGKADVLAAVDIIGDGYTTEAESAAALSPPQYGTAIDYAFAHFARHKLPVALNAVGGNEDSFAKVRKIVMEHVANLLRGDVKRAWAGEEDPAPAAGVDVSGGKELSPNSELSSGSPLQPAANTTARTSKTLPATSKPTPAAVNSKQKGDGSVRAGSDSVRPSKLSRASASPDTAVLEPPPIRMTDLGPERYRYCYCCGRHNNVKLTPCPRCALVYYCSKQCRTKNWNAFHKDECETPAEIAEKAAAAAAAAAARAGQSERDDGSSMISVDGGGDNAAAAASLLHPDSKSKPVSQTGSLGGDDGLGGKSKKGGKKGKKKGGSSRGASEGRSTREGGKKGKSKKNLGANAFKPVKSGKFGRGGVSGTLSQHSMMGRGLMGDGEHSAGDHILSRQNLKGAKSRRGGATDDGLTGSDVDNDEDDHYGTGRAMNLGGNIDREQMLGMATHFATLFGHLISRLVTRGDLNLAKFDDIVELQTSEYFMRFATAEEIDATLALVIGAEANRSQNDGSADEDNVATDVQLKQQSVFDRMELRQALLNRKNSPSDADEGKETAEDDKTGKGSDSVAHKAVKDGNYSFS